MVFNKEVIMMNEEQIQDIQDKKNMLKIIDWNNEKEVEVVNIMLLLGLGYTKEKLADGRVEEVWGHKQDWFYHCELGKIIDNLNIEKGLDKRNYNILNEHLLITAEKLSKKQLKCCAKNMMRRLEMIMHLLEEPTDVSDEIKEQTIKQFNKCNEVLNNL